VFQSSLNESNSKNDVIVEAIGGIDPAFQSSLNESNSKINSPFKQFGTFFIDQ